MSTRRDGAVQACGGAEPLFVDQTINGSARKGSAGWNHSVNWQCGHSRPTSFTTLPRARNGRRSLMDLRRGGLVSGNE
jgi:hypothetical protein